MDEVPEVARVARGVGRRLVPVEPVEVRVVAVRVVVAHLRCAIRIAFITLPSCLCEQMPEAFTRHKNQKPLNRQTRVTLTCQPPGSTCDPGGHWHCFADMVST